jgi:hypothetical protein
MRMKPNLDHPDQSGAYYHWTEHEHVPSCVTYLFPCKPVSSTPSKAPTGLPSDSQERKKYPIASGVLDYFPDAIAAIAHVSYVGNEQHNPGEPLHWDRSKSTDQADTAIRHFLERGKFDSDGTRHSAKFAWRALALLQLEIEADRATTTATKEAITNA